MVANTHAFLQASLYLGSGTDLRRATKSPSSLVGVVRGRMGEPLAPPKVIIVSPQGGSVEASKDQVVARVMPGFLDGHIPKEMTIHP